MKALVTLFAILTCTSAFASCPAECVPGPGTPDYAVSSCQMINMYPNDLKIKTCATGINGCVLRQAQEYVQCVPGPGTPSYAVSSCQMINQYPNDLKIQTCSSGINGCMLQSQCM